MDATINNHTTVTHVTITGDQAGQRIDNFLMTHLKGVPKSYIYRILRKGEVRVNKGRIKQTYRIQEADIIRIPPIRLEVRQTKTPHEYMLSTLASHIVYEDEALLVINKPSGMAVHGGSGIDNGVIEGLRALYPNYSYLELVHRLDRDTSGCLMIAKKRSMLRRLHALLRTPQGMKKKYCALIKGQWHKGLSHINLPLEKNVVKSGERIVRVSEQGKPALSYVQLAQQYQEAAFVNISIATGRTHQIRVHTSHSGHPIAGDPKYGDEVFNQWLKKEYAFKRLFLHAKKLEFHLPDIDYHLKIEAPLPDELTALLQKLER